MKPKQPITETPLILTNRALERVCVFYEKEHPEIKASHGWEHVQRVYQHAVSALESLTPPLSGSVAMEIKISALLHDVDDKKYFPAAPKGQYPNAESILNEIGLKRDEKGNNSNGTKAHSTSSSSSHERILMMISWVSCSENGNSVPHHVIESGDYHLLIPRWADRLEAVGAQGVVRCYQYTIEKGGLLCSDKSPRPSSEEELWARYATPDRFQAYQERGGSSSDMISHYFDKLLHIARPPNAIVRNPYLEEMARESSQPLVEVCLRFGKTGSVDIEYIEGLQTEIGCTSAARGTTRTNGSCGKNVFQCQALSSFCTYGWTPDATLSTDDNLLDLLLLVTRSSTCRDGSMACIITNQQQQQQLQEEPTTVSTRNEEAPNNQRQQEEQQPQQQPLDNVIILAVATNRSLYSENDSDIHAEVCALGQCASRGRATIGSTAYITMPPCKRCLGALVVAGIQRIVYPRKTPPYLQEVANNHHLTLVNCDDNEEWGRRRKRVDDIIGKYNQDHPTAEADQQAQVALRRQQRKEEKQRKRRRRLDKEDAESLTTS